MMSSYLHRTCLTSLIGLGLLTMMMMLPGLDGSITVPPNNTAVLNGSSNVTMSCTSSLSYQAISWSYLPVGSSSTVTISTGTSYVPDTQNYAVGQSGDKQNNLIIFSASPARAGTYYCSDAVGSQPGSAQLIIINADPVCTMTPNAPTELLWNQAVQMSCSLSFTANTLYVNVNMIWSKDGSTANIPSASQMTNSSSLLTTVSSNITQTPGNFTPFPIYRCKTTFGLTNLPTGSANNDPGYSKTTPLFNLPINVIYLNQANASTIQGAKSGDQVYLGTNVTCNVDAYPAASYSWLDVAFGNTTNSSSIQIWHDGEYRCTASNRAAITSASINVTTYSGLSDTNKIIIGVVVGVGGALVIAGIVILICCCMKKKNKAGQLN